MFNLFKIIKNYRSKWFAKGESLNVQRKYKPLTAVKNVSTYDNYKDAFEFIRDESDLRNIALTGNYGSGKSSLLLTFQNNNKELEFLNLSLATFDLQDGSKAEESEIEKSIFKQMLYGEHANKLHYSRFRGITSPKASWIKSFIIFFLIVGLYFGLKYHTQVYVISQKGWFQFGIAIATLSAWCLCTVAVIRHLYKISIGLTVKKVAIQGASVEAESKESIFNEHLDEIVYFFQSTNYDFVLIEDLDRFNNTNIFINLRELNCLINKNNEIKKKRNGNPIKFVYAIRDGMFKDKDRTKFFDFIIPVIPFVNTSNSYDKLDELLKELGLRSGIDNSFLRDISLHINDFRHLNNTVNEYSIYRDNLNNDLDQTKLFAIILYKNFYPEDFENLHEGNGELFNILKNKNIKLQELQESLNERISKIDESTLKAKASLPRNIQSLVHMYVGLLVTKFEENTSHIYTPENTRISIHDITIDHLLTLASRPSQVIIVLRNGSRIQSNVTMSELQTELHPGMTLPERKEELQICNRDNLADLQKSLHEVLEEMRQINHTPLSVLYTREELRKFLAESNLNSPDLLIYLIIKGFIDENYHLYISYFHEGAITKSDHDFLLNCQADRDIEPQYIVNNPEELCHRLGVVFFEKRQCLNITLFDHILSDSEKYKVELNNATNYIQRNISKCESFLVSYYATGTELAKLIHTICLKWDKFAETICKSNLAHIHVANLISKLRDDTVLLKQNSQGTITSYLEKSCELVFNQNICRENYHYLQTLEVKIKSLQKCAAIPDFIDSAINQNAFSISVKNIDFILKHLKVSQEDINSANYTSIQECSNDLFKEYINENITEYIKNVFLSLPSNTKENETHIIHLLNNDNVSTDLKQCIIEIQTINFMFASIPKDLWAYVLEHHKVIITWDNLAVYHSSDESNEKLTEFFNSPVVYQALSKQRTGDKNKDLVSFVIKNNKITDEAYKLILASEVWTIHSLFEGLSKEKWLYLINRNFVKLNKDTYTVATADPQVCAALIRSKFNTYSQSKNDYPIDNDVIEHLLESDLSEGEKLTLCYDIDSTTVRKYPRLMALASKFFAKDELDINKVEPSLSELVFSYAPDIKTSVEILCKMIPSLDEDKTMYLLRELGGNYKKIATYGSWVIMQATRENSKLASLLLEHEYISSAPEKDGTIRFNMKKSPN